MENKCRSNSGIATAYGADERVDSEDLLERRGGKVYTDIDDDIPSGLDIR
jgi:hypothetical protein